VIKTAGKILKLAAEEFLLDVEKPARYIGQEFNVIDKEVNTNTINFALCFPDVYEVGMSHLGIKILYNILNKQPDVYCQRCFAPWTDMEQIMRGHKIPLFSLETQSPLSTFDILGFSLQYELSYTNVLNMLELADIPLYSKDRDVHPLVIAGGHCCYNPEPMAEFIDAFVIGEAEEVILEIVDAYRRFKSSQGRLEDNSMELIKAQRNKLLSELARIEGVYVPQLFFAAQKIKRRYIKDLDEAEVPVSLPVPFIEVIHDRIVLEIMRGCPNQCFFCQAGFAVNPVRIRSVDKLLHLAQKTYLNTGYDNISFCALSSANYPYLDELINRLHPFCKEKGLGISLSSLRINTDFAKILSLIGDLKKSGLTFAPEAGSERLRRLINKNIDMAKLKQAIASAYRSGWRRIKLYFMIGLPTETEADLAGIIDLIEEIAGLKKTIDGKRANISVSISNFIPKPHTPFQWLGMEKKDNILLKQRFLKTRLMKKGWDVDFHDSAMNFIEAYLSRGDRNIHKVILRAFKAGARFDAWSNMFNFELWQQILKENTEHVHEHVYRQRNLNSKLPWGHIDCGIDKSVLYNSVELYDLKKAAA